MDITRPVFQSYRALVKVVSYRLFLYLCFIDDLLNEICECGAGFKTDGVCYAAPTVCDDMLLLALSKMS